MSLWLLPAAVAKVATVCCPQEAVLSGYTKQLVCQSTQHGTKERTNFREFQIEFEIAAAMFLGKTGLPQTARTYTLSQYT